jgi:ribosomal protein S18 acetylase RimI-like enzyme
MDGGPISGRAYAGPDDLARMVALVAACRAAAPDGDYEYVGDVCWGMRLLDTPEHDVRLWEQRGEVVAYARVAPGGRSILWQIRPELDDALREEALGWCLDRAREVAGGGLVGAEARPGNIASIALLERSGFRQASADLAELAWTLPHRIEPLVRAGFSLRGYEPTDLDRYVALHRAAWSTRRPSTYDVEQHRRVSLSPAYRPELNVIAVAPDGELAASCIGWLDEVNRLVQIEPVGTHPTYTRQGLARAVVLESVERARTLGATRAVIYTSTSNEPAMALYRQIGFEPIDRVIAFEGEL